MTNNDRLLTIEEKERLCELYMSGTIMLSIEGNQVVSMIKKLHGYRVKTIGSDNSLNSFYISIKFIRYDSVKVFEIGRLKDFIYED